MADNPQSLIGDVPDFGKAANDYARHRQGFPSAFFDDLAALGVGAPGQNVLDMGTGTGLVARALARRGHRVTGLDPSPDLIAAARALDAKAGVEIDYRLGRAEETGLPDASFDAITAGTCWHWFDKARAARECRRLLRPEGRLAIAHLEWLRMPGNVIDLTLEAICDHNPTPFESAGSFQYPDWLDDLMAAGFDAYRLFGSSVRLRYTRESWIGRIIASAPVGPVMTPDQLTAFTDDFSLRLRGAFPDPMDVDHRIIALVLWRR